MRPWTDVLESRCISITEGRHYLDQFVDAVSDGTAFVITRRGKATARAIPFDNAINDIAVRSFA